MRTTDKTRRILLSLCAMLIGIGVAPVSASAATISVSAEGGGLAVIRGVVRDDGGSPIADASIAIFHNGTTKLLKQVASARDGSFIAKIVPGTYTVLAVAQGFNPSYVFGVDVGRSVELSYGFKLERAGSGNTLPEKRLDRNSSKWRIRAAQMQRSIYQNREGASPIETDDDADVADTQRERKSQTVVETSFAGGDQTGTSVSFATLLPVGETSEVVVAGQAGTGTKAPKRLETSFKLDLTDDHRLRLTTAVARLGSLPFENEMRPLGQVSFQATDEWKIREGIILVYGVDYSRFFGAGDDFSISPRLGLQYDLNSRTRLRTAFTSQTEEKTWARSLDLEGQNIAFSEPVSVDDLVLEHGKPRMNKSRRLEFGVERVIDNRSSIDANVFLDTTLTRGVGINALAFDTLDGDGFGDFVANQQGRSSGLRLVYNRRLNRSLSFASGYALGTGQRLADGIAAGIANGPNGIFETDFFQSFFAQITADLKTGTTIRSIYRLSPEASVFAIDPFKGRLAIYDPGLSVLVTHPLPNFGLPFRAQAIVDARNVFDTQAGLAGEESAFRLTDHRRLLRGGIQVRF